MQFVIDENMDAPIIESVRNRLASEDIAFAVTRAQDEMRGAPDDELLAWAAGRNRVVVSFDKDTLTDFAWQRVWAGNSMPGVIALKRLEGTEALGADLATMIGSGRREDFENQVRFIPITCRISRSFR